MLRRLRWRYRFAFIVPFAILVICASWVSASLYHRIRVLPVLGASLAGAFACRLVFMLVESSRLRRHLAQRPPTTEIVSLESFLSDPDAIITPNRQEVSAAVARWLTEFCRHHGSESVFVSREFDEPHIANIVLLVTPQLTEAEEQALLSFRIDSISKLDHKEARRLIPSISPNTRAFSVLWD